jgi:histidine triad (HIT) family protein
VECVFCRILRGEIPAQRVHEDDACVAILDINPVAPGHVLVLPREHHETWLDLPDALADRLARASRVVARAAVAAAGAEGFNLLANNKRCSGQAIPHVHLHVIPRKEGDGVRFQWPAKSADPVELQVQAERIRQVLRSNP